MDDQQSNNLQDLAATFGDLQITDDEGNVAGGQPATQTTAAEEPKPPVTDPAPAEKPLDSEPTAPQPEATTTESELAEDEAGRKYVPEKRFKEIYGKAKATERELEALRAKLQQQAVSPESQATKTSKPAAQADKTMALEAELLRATLPQFNQDSEEYSPEIDSLGAQIYAANPGITMIEAGRRAIKMASSLASKTAAVQAEARTVKALQSDQGITRPVVSRAPQGAPGDNASPEELEAWLKANGQW